ncbi:MAG TPA: O-methyltransferase [Bacilli bacterium]|nr:O-methyltransferase [Bacilli bacterium]
MNHNQLHDYLEKLRQPATDWQAELEAEARRDQIPIMERDGIDFLKQMLRLNQPKRILELGSAIGYSALQMADAVPNAHIVTIERDHERAKRAIENFNEHNSSQTIELIVGDAFDVADQVKQKGRYDLIFIDAAKGQYQRFFELFASMLTPKGVIVTDNVLFHGYVVDSSNASKRIQKLAQKIDTYNQWLANQFDYQTDFYPIGDGIAISIKKS